MNPGELEAVLGRLREAIIKEYGEQTRLRVQSQEATEMQNALAKQESIDRQSGDDASAPASAGTHGAHKRTGDPLFENPFRTEDARHSSLAPYFEMLRDFRTLAKEYPDLSMKWIAASGNWRSWPPPYAVVGGDEGMPFSPGGDLHVRRIAGEAAERLLRFSGSSRADAVRVWLNHGRDRWLNPQDLEAWEFWLYAIREFWLTAREEAEAGKRDMQSLNTLCGREGYLLTVGRRVWNLIVTERKSLRQVLKEQQLPAGGEISAVEEAASWIEDGKIGHVFTASAYFCGVLAARRAMELEAESASFAIDEAAPVDFVSSESAELWRARQSEFKNLLARQCAALGQPPHPVWLLGRSRFSKDAVQYCRREGGVDGLFLSEFDEVATRAACALSRPEDVDPVKHWIYH